MGATQREETAAMISCPCGCIPRLARRGLIASALSLTVFPSWAQTSADPGLVDDVVTANRILYDEGVVDGFGHISARHDKDPGRYLLSRSMAPALVTAADIMEFDLDSNPIDARGRTPYLERFIHGEIYKVRPDVMAIVHSHSPAVLRFAATTGPLFAEEPDRGLSGLRPAGVRNPHGRRRRDRHAHPEQRHRPGVGEDS